MKRLIKTGFHGGSDCFLFPVQLIISNGKVAANWCTWQKLVSHWPLALKKNQDHVALHITLQETNISHLGKKENHLQICLIRGYVNSLEGNT